MTLTLADWCIFVAGVIVPFVFTIYAKADKRFDNARPRVYMAALEGARQRAYWAVQNGQETFPLFAVAVLLAERAAVVQGRVDAVAVAFVICRVVYGLLYMFDQATLRSLVWLGSLGLIVSLFVSAA